MKNIKLFFFVIFLIFFLSIILSQSFATLYIVNDQEENNICITNNESDILKYKNLGYIIIPILGSGSSKQSPESEPINYQPQAESKPNIQQNGQPEHKVIIIDSNNRLSTTSNYYYVEGILKNTGKTTVTNLKVKIQSLDKNSKLISINEGYATPSTLAPNQEATYKVMVNYNSKINTFKTTVYCD